MPYKRREMPGRVRYAAGSERRAWGIPGASKWVPGGLVVGSNAKQISMEVNDLKIGHTYRDRQGHHWTILEIKTNGRWPILAGRWGNRYYTRTYHSNGRYADDPNRDDLWDLIAEGWP